MTTYSKLNFVYRLQKWMDSVAGQTFLNYAYSWGASIVILGTLFKLTHLPGANFFLFLGMGTEVFVFFISAFDRPFDKTTDGMDLDVHMADEEGAEHPVVAGGVVGGGIIGGNGGTIVINGGGGGAVGSADVSSETADHAANRAYEDCRCRRRAWRDIGHRDDERHHCQDWSTHQCEGTCPERQGISGFARGA